MLIDLPNDNNEFRQLVRTWLLDHYPRFKSAWGTNVSHANAQFRRAWEDYLCTHGWSALGWPKQYGGYELDVLKQAIFHEELAYAQTPLGVNLIGHGILAPTLLHFGTEEQKQSFLPNLKLNKDIWCQGYSEPMAGSDLAAVRTRAIKSGDKYILNGHKVWTSFADQSDWCFVLARTDKDSVRHKGLSFLLVNMHQQGVRVEPIKQLTGHSDFCEVFFEDVEVPVKNILGKENEGWKIAMAAASFERGTYFIPRLIKFSQELSKVKQIINQKIDKGLSDFEQHSLKSKWAKLAIDSHVLSLKSDRALQQVISGNPPGPEGSSTKVHWSEAHQDMLEFALTLINDEQNDIAQSMDLEFIYLWSQAETILAGTSEIQRNVIAERVLGLPRA